MKLHPRPSLFIRAFTLVEMLAVMLVIAVLTSLTIGIWSYASYKMLSTRATGEIATLAASIANYEGDFGTPPRDTDSPDSFKAEEEVTDKLDPREDGDPSAGKYRNSSLYLYISLTGDILPKDEPDGKSDEKAYIQTFPPKMIGRNGEGQLKFIKDPWGGSYGYSTAGLKMEIKYKDKLKDDPTAARSTIGTPQGYNPTFDLWSTAGKISVGANQIKNDQAKWVKNW